MIRRPPRPTLFPSTPPSRSRTPASPASPGTPASTPASCRRASATAAAPPARGGSATTGSRCGRSRRAARSRSEEHTSELQSRQYLVCRLLLEKKKTIYNYQLSITDATPVNYPILTNYCGMLSLVPHFQQGSTACFQFQHAPISATHITHLPTF